MIDNKISATVAQEDLDAILGAVNQIKTRLPFLTKLNQEDRRMMAKAGDRSRAFIIRSLEVAGQNPTIIPQVFDLEEMRKDVDLFHKLQQILLSLNQLAELVSGTATIVEWEAYTAALSIYNYAKVAGKSVPLDEALGDLKRRFNRKSKTPAKTPATLTPSTSTI